MNEIKTDEELKNILCSTIATLEVFLIRAYDCDKADELKILINEFNEFKSKNEIYPQVVHLFDAVWSEMTRMRFCIINTNSSEFLLHTIFKESVSDLLYGAKIANKKNDRNHIPDFWVEYNGEEIPVEIKRFVFDDSARDQLSRYMKFYDCSMGIAVAPILKTELPESMIFLSVDIQ